MQRPRLLTAGFTLIEVLVSLLILAVLAATCWKGVDAISTARQVADGHLQQTLRLQAVMTQIEADLQGMVDLSVVDPLIVDSRHLRLTRRGTAGAQVVVWYMVDNQLYRWASPPATVIADLQKYWLTGFQLSGNEAGSLLALDGVDRLQVYCYSGGSLANCQSTRSATVSTTSSATSSTSSSASGTTTSTSSTVVQRQPLPEAMRVQLGLGEGSGFAGLVTRELMVGPQ